VSTPRPDQHRPVPSEGAHSGGTDGGGDPTYGPSALATPANMVTTLRLLVAPILFAMIYDKVATWPNFLLWTALAATDGVDGFIARRHGTTRSGAFLDPLADKVLVLGAMFALVAARALPMAPVVLIAVRELGISVYRAYWGRRGLAVPARQTAKVKTLLQALAVGAALLPWTAPYQWIANVVLWASVFMAYLSAWQYLRDGRRARTDMTGTA